MFPVPKMQSISVNAEYARVYPIRTVTQIRRTCSLM